jgi:hypothetical protein
MVALRWRGAVLLSTNRNVSPLLWRIARQRLRLGFDDRQIDIYRCGIGFQPVISGVSQAGSRCHWNKFAVC